MVQEEVEEVEAKLEASEQQPRTKWQRVLTQLCTPVFLEAFILTFLAGQPLLVRAAALQAVDWCTRMQSHLIPCLHDNPGKLGTAKPVRGLQSAAGKFH